MGSERRKVYMREYLKNNPEYVQKKIAYDKEYRLRNKEKRRLYNIKYRAEHPVYSQKQRDYSLNRLRMGLVQNRFKRYGINIEDFETMVKNQNNLCAVCFKIMTSPNVDHNHKTGKNRELLCRYCNTGLGMFFENISILENAINYLNKHSVETGGTHI